MKIKFFVFILITAVCFIAYFNSLANPFIWDDDALVARNPFIRSWNFLPQAFSKDLFAGAGTGFSNFYRPLQTVSYMWDYHLWQLNPSGYHITNIFLQGLAGFLVFLFIYVLINKTGIALASALLFSLSPIHTEAVTYISGRAEMLLGIWLILSLLFFIKSQSAGDKLALICLVLSWGSYCLALLSKELAVVFPLAIGGYAYYFHHEKLSLKYFLKNIFPFFLIAFFYVLIRAAIFNFPTLKPAALSEVAFFTRLSALPEVFFTYLKLLIFPFGLHMSRQLQQPAGGLGLSFSLLVLWLLACFCLRLLRYDSRRKVLSFFIFWFLIFFIPQSGILPINAFISEHFIYLPSISFFAALAVFLNAYLRRRIFILCLSGILIFYIFLTLGRNYEWRNPVVFYKKIIEFSPDSFQAHNNLGWQYEAEGVFGPAESEYKLALKIKPDLLEARSNLANLYYKLKRYDQAKKEYEIIEKSAPRGGKAAEVENNIANIYYAQGLFERAIEKYKLALLLEPKLAFSHFNLARIYFIKGSGPEASRQIYYSLFGGKAPARKDYLQVISDYLSGAGNVSQAKDFYNNLGVKFTAWPAFEPAIICFEKAIELDADFGDAYFNLGLAYLKTGRKKQAVSALKSCLRVNPNYLNAKRLLTEN